MGDDRRLFFVDGVVHLIDVRLAQYPLRILLTFRTLHASCMVAPLSTAVVYRRSYLLIFFSRKVERHRACFAARIFIAFFIVRCGKQLPSRREQYITKAGAPRT